MSAQDTGAFYRPNKFDFSWLYNQYKRGITPKLSDEKAKEEFIAKVKREGKIKVIKINQNAKDKKCSLN